MASSGTLVCAEVSSSPITSQGGTKELVDFSTPDVTPLLNPTTLHLGFVPPVAGEMEGMSDAQLQEVPPVPGDYGQQATTVSSHAASMQPAANHYQSMLPPPNEIEQECWQNTVVPNAFDQQCWQRSPMEPQQWNTAAPDMLNQSWQSPPIYDGEFASWSSDHDEFQQQSWLTNGMDQSWQSATVYSNHSDLFMPQQHFGTIQQSQYSTFHAPLMHGTTEYRQPDQYHAVQNPWEFSPDSVDRSRMQYDAPEQWQGLSGGYVFHCSPTTRDELFGRALCGAPQKMLAGMIESINNATRLFVFEPVTKRLYGPLVAAGPPGESLEPDAWGGRFPAQVPFYADSDIKCIHAPSLRLLVGRLSQTQAAELEYQLYNEQPSGPITDVPSRTPKKNRRSQRAQNQHHVVSLENREPQIMKLAKAMPTEQAEAVLATDRKIKSLKNRIRKIEGTIKHLGRGDRFVECTARKQVSKLPKLQAELAQLKEAHPTHLVQALKELLQRKKP